MNIWLSLVAVAGLGEIGIASAPGPAEAKSKLKVRAKPALVKPGGAIRIAITGSRTRRCSLAVRRGDRLSFERRIGKNYTFGVAKNSVPGTRRVRVRCGRQKASTSFRVASARPRVTGAAPGSVVLAPADANQACGSAFGRRYESNNALLGPGRIVVVECGPQSDSGTGYLGYDVDRGRTVWTHGANADLAAVVGVERLFTVTTNTTPAAGLQGASTVYVLHAIDLRTGRQAWQAPLTVDNPDDRELRADHEGVSGLSAHPVEAVVSFGGGTSAFNAVNGTPLWHVPRTFRSLASGSYAAAGVVEAGDDGNRGLTGSDVRTGSKLWRLEFPTCDTSKGTPAPGTGFNLVGAIEWRFTAGCTTLHNVATGQVLSQLAWPPSASNSLVFGSPSGLVAWDGAKLSFYRPDNYSTPIWAVSSSAVTARAISKNHVLVSAPAGAQLLSRADGRVVKSVPAPFNEQVSETREGLVAHTAINGDVSVLSMDPN